MSLEVSENTGHFITYVKVRGRLYSGCVRSSRMVRWMIGMKLQDRIPSTGLRERLGLDNISSVLQQYSTVQYAVEGARPRGRPNKTWREIVN